MKDTRPNSDGASQRTGLGAYMSPVAMVALAFGYAVGWGAFVLPGTQFLPDAGPLGTLIGILIGTAAMSVFALNYYRLVIRRPGPGGAYGFVTKAFGADHGFLVGWFLFITYIAIMWANSTALVIMTRCVLGDVLQFGFHYTMVGFDVYFGEAIFCSAVIVLCGVLCLIGKRLAIGIHTALAAVMVLGVATCFVAALFRHQGGLASMAPAFSSDGPPAVQILRILAMIPWAFVGFEAVVHSSGEFKFPVKRTLPLMIAAIVLAALVYILLTMVPVLALPERFSTWQEYIKALPELVGADAVPVFATVHRILGVTGTAILGGTMLAAQLTGIFATYVATSRLLCAMSRGRMVPRWFGAINRDGTPANAIVFVMLASLAIPFFGRTVTGWPVDVSNLGAAVAYGYVSAAAYAISRREGETGVLARASGVCGVVMAVAFFLLMLVPNYLSGNTLSAESYFLLAIWCILGILLYRRVFRLDRHRWFGRSIVVWVGVIVVIFFSSIMWFRLTLCDSTEAALGGYVGKMFDREAYTWLARHIERDMLLKSVVELCLLVASLAIMLNLFSILRRREKRLIDEKLKAEESASKSKSYFFSTVSHDIRTPLNAIIGFSEMLKMGFREKAEREQAIDSILVSSRTLLNLVNDVLDFSKLEDGRMEIVPEPTDFVKLLASIEEAFRIANKNPALEFRRRTDEMPVLMIDPQRIRQILFNLVGNAAKFTQSGFVEVRGSFTRAGAGAKTGTLRIDVEDTGCGISRDDMERIASPYVQVRSKLARHGGTGLGLAICRQLASAMGGELTIASTLGKGSTFTVTIPGVKTSDEKPVDEPHGITLAPEDFEMTEIPEAPESPAIPEKPESPAIPEKPTTPTTPKEHHARRILIVDDQKMNLMVLKAMLKKLGDFDIVMAANGAEALKALEDPNGEPFDLVLTDMWMPKLDGEGLVKAIRGDERLAGLSVHIVTADVEMLKKSESPGYSGILLKPVTVDKLKSILNP